MGILENIKLSLSNLLANKLRSILTMLGIIIGISSVIAIVTIGDSLANSITNEMSGVGGRNINVYLNQKNLNQGSENTNLNEGIEEDENIDDEINFSDYVEPTEKDYITDEMLADYKIALGSEIEGISLSENAGNIDITNGKNKANINIFGVNNGFFKVENIKLLEGRFIQDKDLKDLRNIAVVSDVFVDDYFGKKYTYNDVVGKSFEVTIGKNMIRVYICGVYEFDKSSLGTNNGQKLMTTGMYIPISVVKKINNLKNGYESITILPSINANIDAVVNKTNDFFAAKYKNNEHIVPMAVSVESMMKAANEMINSVKLAIGAVAAISLLVGGIGVMNIMMVSITERTREIGIRKALGASRGVILIQFVIEAIIICVIGGLIGITIGIGLGAIGARLIGYPVKPNMSSILGAVMFSMSIGVFFGYYPASKAAKLNPIDALRYE